MSPLVVLAVVLLAMGALVGRDERDPAAARWVLWAGALVAAVAHLVVFG